MVDEDDLHDGFPLGQSNGGGLQMGSLRNRGLRRRKNLFWVSPSGFPNIFEFIGLELGQSEPHGAHKAPGRAYPSSPGITPALWLPRASFGLLQKLPGFLYVQKKSPKIFIMFGLHLVWISWKTKNMQKA